jgi:hypothetical protein
MHCYYRSFRGPLQPLTPCDTQADTTRRIYISPTYTSLALLLFMLYIPVVSYLPVLPRYT